MGTVWDVIFRFHVDPVFNFGIHIDFQNKNVGLFLPFVTIYAGRLDAFSWAYWRWLRLGFRSREAELDAAWSTFMEAERNTRAKP